MHETPFEHLREAARFIKEHFNLENMPNPQVAMVLGSGLGDFAERIKRNHHAKTLSFGDVPYFSMSSVEGHKGEIIYSMIDDRYPVLLLNGRLHRYEGHSAQHVVIPTRVVSLLGIKTLIITNAAGAIGDDYEPGQLMVLSDHINFTGDSPLVGKNLSELGARFLDLTDAYDKELRLIAKACATEAGIVMHEGVYVCMLGPCYETPAEIRMLKTLGADAVGMSTIYETIAARHMGIKVLAISCLTNKAAGLSAQKITHEEVMEINAQVSTKLGQILCDVVKQISHD